MNKFKKLTIIACAMLLVCGTASATNKFKYKTACGTKVVIKSDSPITNEQIKTAMELANKNCENA